MQESASEGETAVPAPSRRNLFFAMKCLSAALGATVLWCAIWLMLENAPLMRDAGWHLCLPTLILTMVCLLAYRENRKWWRPTRRFKEILEGCRAGKRPIDELNEVGGGLAGVAGCVQSLIRDLRNQKRLTAELEAELGQRVASRTHALERQMGSLRVKATRDPLTGLHNRRLLEERLPQMIQQCRDDGSELSILAIDVDNFKPLNDSLGHAVGDEFLRSIAQILRSGIRACDVAIRCGGDEFLILLPGCSLDAARALADRLASLVEALARTIKSPLAPGLSVGAVALSQVARNPSTEPAATAFLAAADKQLYLKKASRKRRVA